VRETSDALDLEAGVFRLRTARQIAQSLKRSADRSTRRKARPFQSAMSMLNFYVNRGGRNLSAARKRTLEAAKEELRRLFGRDSPQRARGRTVGKAARSPRTRRRTRPRVSGSG
jgi:hypothetical protein